jgi:hypothetical protein
VRTSAPLKVLKQAARVWFGGESSYPSFSEAMRRAGGIQKVRKEESKRRRDVVAYLS